MSRPNPSEAVIDRIRAVGEKAFVAFLDEVSDAGTQALSDTLPPVPGFRKNSQVGIRQRKRALFKEFAANRNPASKNRMKADQALYGFWRLWAIEHLGDPDGVEALIDAIEAADEEEDAASKSAEALLALFARLRQLSIENKCSRESIDRFFQFGPFDENPEIRALIDSAKPAGEIDRELAMEGLPQRLRHDEEEIRSLEGQLHILSTRIEASTDEAHAIRKELAAFQTEVSRLASKSDALGELLEEQAQSTAHLTSQEREAQAFMKEARERLAQLTGELGSLAADTRRIEMASSSAAVAVAARIAALEEAQTNGAPMPPALALAPPTGAFQPRRLPAGGDGKVAALTSLEDATACIASNLERIGLRKSAARPLAEETCAAAFAGQVVFFKGSLATAVARCAAVSLSGSASVRVSMPLGLSSAEAFDGIRDFIDPAIAFASALVIEGINRTALDIYADAVADLLAADHSAEERPGFDFIFATVMQGVAALAIEPRHLELGPVFDLDHLEWRVRRAAAPLAPGSISLDVLRDIRGLLESGSVEAEELLRLLRRFVSKKNPRIEGAAVAASASLNAIGRRGPPTVLQSLAFGWIVPLWLALEVSREEADAELDNGKCDSGTADPRLASIFASEDFGQREPAR